MLRLGEEEKLWQSVATANDETERFFGGYSEKVTPVPIPNTVVKLLCADNTWRATSREHKSPPELIKIP